MGIFFMKSCAEFIMIAFQNGVPSIMAASTSHTHLKVPLWLDDEESVHCWISIRDVSKLLSISSFLLLLSFSFFLFLAVVRSLSFSAASQLMDECRYLSTRTNYAVIFFTVVTCGWFFKPPPEKIKKRKWNQQNFLVLFCLGVSVVLPFQVFFFFFNNKKKEN